MSFFLRKVRGAQWDGASSCDPEWQGKARKDFSLREGEETFSLYEATTEAERTRTAAALVLHGRERKPIDLLEVTTEELSSIGILVRDGCGDTNLPDVNARHCSLKASQSALHTLVDTLRASGRKHQRHQWKEHLLPTLKSLDREALVGDDADEAREWLAKTCPTTDE
jgi:hypothetical protein